MTGWDSAGRLRPAGTGGGPAPGHPWLRPGLLLLPVILLAWALYLHNLEAKSLWFDELGTLTCAAWDGTWADALRRSLTDLALPKPPLYFLLTRLFLALGDRVLLLRLPAALWATLTIPLAYALAVRLLAREAGRRAGLLAALLLALAPFYVRYGQEARMYTMLTFLALLSLYLFVRAVRDGTWGRWLAFALAAAANLYVHLFALLPLGVMGLYAGWLFLRPGGRARSRDEAWRPAAALALVFLLFLPMVPYLLRGLGGELGLGGGAPSSRNAAIILDTLRLWSGGSDAGLAVYLPLLALGAGWLAVRHRGLLLAALAWVILPFALVMLLPFGQALRARYFIFALPVYLGVAACGLCLAIDWLARPARPRAGALLAGLLLVGAMAAVSAPSLAAFYAEEKQNWRDASRLVVQQAGPGDVVYVRHRYHQVGFLFYAGGWAGQAGRWTTDNVRLLPGDLSRVFRLADQASYWLLVPERGTFLPGGALEQQAQPHFQILPPATFSCEGVPREAEVLGPTGYRTVMAVHAVPARPPSVRFWADDAVLPPGACTWLRWQVENVREVYLDGEGVPGQAGRQVCPAGTAGYALEVTHLDGSVSSAAVQIEIRP